MQSLIDQTYQDFEIVAVDNNCTDKTMEIVGHVVEPSGKLRIVKCGMKGIVPALNTGLRASTGEWIARQDGDDYWYPEKLQKQMDFLQSNKDVSVLGTQIRLLDTQGNVEEQPNLFSRIFRDRRSCFHALFA